MGAIWLLIGLAVGGGAVWWVLRSRVRTTEAERDQARDDLHAAVEGLQDAEARRAQLDRAKLTDVGAVREELAGVRAELEGALTQVKTLTEAREDLVAQVKESAGEVFAARGKEFIDLAKAEAKRVTAEAQTQMQQRENAIRELVDPMKERLTEVGESVKRLDYERVRTHAELTEKLLAVSNETSSLAKALRQPHTRGQWGEYHLRRAAEMAGMTPYCDFIEQSHLDDDGKTLRPDMVVRIPGDKQVPVDAKAPLAQYLQACEADDSDVRRAHTELYARGLRAHVKKLAAKKYWQQLDSPDFVVMYLPGEQYLGAALEVDGTLLDDAFKRRVILASPTTLVTLLWSVACGWQQAKVADEARAIADIGRDLYTRLGVLLGHIDTVSRRLNSLNEAQNAVVGSIERRVLPTARRFPDLGVVGASSELESPRSVNSIAREVQAPELPHGQFDEEEHPSQKDEGRPDSVPERDAGEEAA